MELTAAPLRRAGSRTMGDLVLLRADGITKTYPGVQALKSASLELRAGEVHALVGENGAGKSTLIKIFTGAVQPDSGEISLNGRAITNNSPRLAKNLGIAAIYQQPALFPELTVAENIALGSERPAHWRRVDWKERRRRAAELLSLVGARIDPNCDAGDLTMPQQQLVEIARALGSDAKVVIFDEPTSSLSEQDARNLFQVICDLRARGVGIVYISHRLEELPAIADRVTVLRDGCTIATRPISGVSRAQLIQMMVGRDISVVFPKRAVDLGDTVLELHAVGCRQTGVHDVHLAVRGGEIVGLAGLVGAGRTELANILFGLTPADTGEIRIRGQSTTIQTPSHAIERGIAYVPEDRRRHGVVPEMSISSNMTLAALGRLSRFGMLDFSRETEIAVEYVARLGVKTSSIRTPVAGLSGGNQQKVALSRWLMMNPSVLILDEPTQGIDVGAKAEVHGLITDLAAKGVAILMISSELPEILGMSDRIAVMRGGTVVEVLNRAVATQEKVLACALGHENTTAAPIP